MNIIVEDILVYVDGDVISAHFSYTGTNGLGLTLPIKLVLTFSWFLFPNDGFLLLQA